MNPIGTRVSSAPYLSAQVNRQGLRFGADAQDPMAELIGKVKKNGTYIVFKNAVIDGTDSGSQIVTLGEQKYLLEVRGKGRDLEIWMHPGEKKPAVKMESLTRRV